MAPTTSMPDVELVVVSTPQPRFLPPPPACFASAPGKHDLSRSGPKSLNETTLLLAVTNSATFRLQTLSVSEELIPTQGPTGTTVGSVQPATSVRTTDWTAVKDSVRHKHLLKSQSNRIEQYSKHVKGGLKTALRNYGDKKGRGAPRAGSTQHSQCPSAEDEGLDIRPIVQVMGGLSIADPMEVTGGPKFHGTFNVDTSTEFMDQNVESLNPASPITTAPHQSSAQSPSPEFSPSAIVTTAEADSTTSFMDEDVPSCATSSARTFQDSKSTTPPSDATLIPKSPLSPLEQDTERKEDISATESKDTVMAEGDCEANNAGFIRRAQTKGSNMEVDCDLSESDGSTVLPKALDSEVTMKHVTGLQNLDPLNCPPEYILSGLIASKQAVTRDPVCRSTIAPIIQPSASLLNSVAQPPSTLQAANDSCNGRSGVDASGVPMPAVTGNVEVLKQMASSAQPARASTVDGADPPLAGDSAKELGPVVNAHATRIHQVQAKLCQVGFASQPSRSTASDKASEDAEADVFLAQYSLGRRCTLVKPPLKKLSPAPAPRPKTKGDASRSLMDDIMVGFASLIKLKSSAGQAPVAAPPSRPAALNVPSAKLAVTQTQPLLSHNVAGRQAGPPFTPPNHIGTRPEVVASWGSVIPSSHAPSSAPMDCEAKVPATRNQQCQQAGPPFTPSTHVGARAEVVASRGSVIPSSRAPSSAPTDGAAKAAKANHSTLSKAALSAAMDASE